MKNLKNYIIVSSTLLLSTGCDKDFVEINTNPYAVNNIDPALLFAGAQRSHLGTWAAEHTIVQQFVVPYNTGANLGFNFNEDVDDINNPKWNQAYPQSIRNMTQAINLLGPNTDRVNLLSMLKIWKAQVFMGLVDEYGDVPYFESGKAVSDGIFYPKYDDDAAIYEDLYKEIKSGVASLNAGGDFVAADLFFGSKGGQPTGTAADQVAKWKKLGNSLLLRLGMRYSKVDPEKAKSIVSEAFSGGVMTSNSDNAMVKYDGTLYVNNENNGLRNFSYFNYAAEPFVDQLKAGSDPRAKYIIATYDDPADPLGDANPDTQLQNQFGVPIGVLSTEILDPAKPYRGSRGGGLNYSQLNINSVASALSPDFWVTYAQTSLLLAEAAHRGWISGSAQAYYEQGITADMKVYSYYPQTSPISDADIAEFLARPGVAFDASRALEQINTQYWIANLRNGTEVFANFRRSGYPALKPNAFNNNLNGGFARRLSYPNYEISSNAENYTAAAAAIGGDNLLSRVFWDKE